MEGHHDGYDPVSSKMSGFKQRVKIETPPRQKIVVWILLYVLRLNYSRRNKNTNWVML